MLIRLVAVALAIAVASSAPLAQAQATKKKFAPASAYICPNQSETALDCYLDAVTYLYTMCRQVKSIEIIEFGHEKAQEGTNGAKSEYCIVKHKLSIAPPLQAALQEARGWRESVDALRTLQQFWADALAALNWQTGESAEDYEARVLTSYADLSVLIDSVRIGFSTPPDALAARQVTPAKPGAARTPPRRAKNI
ncbi:MAG: hypothetical protein H0T80_22040 [Betaproteobacteria bacterium]|nr:hypothetical protein [Betaproteobacteria bacterium]MBA3777555.1 hypothetical protein [Betaproteobacteria bacterium]